jgi:hypothetical protein
MGARRHDSLMFVTMFEERLWPAPWVWIAGPALVGVLSVAYGAAYGALLGWLIFVPVSALTLLGVVLLSPTIRVDADVLYVGRAAIPLSVLGQCRVLDSAELTQETRSGDPTVFMALRTWATHTAIHVEVLDDADPHSGWLVSTRHPRLLQAAICGAEGPHTAPTR